MSTATAPLTLAIARECADDIAHVLHPHCHRIHIAGSIRREKPLVSDIEIVCEPKTEPADMFATEHRRIADFTGTIKRLATRINKGDLATGRYVQFMIGSAKVDLFMPQPDDYYRQLAIRTGSSAYNHKVIAAAWLRNGWCGTKDGLRLIRECYKNTSDQWICTAEIPSVPPAWHSEADFFQWLGIPFLSPKHREV